MIRTVQIAPFAYLVHLCITILSESSIIHEILGHLVSITPFHLLLFKFQPYLDMSTINKFRIRFSKL